MQARCPTMRIYVIVTPTSQTAALVCYYRVPYSPTFFQADGWCNTSWLSDEKLTARGVWEWLAITAVCLPL
jgi:hypothetical protein